jgi:hypothetical protein
MKSCVFSTFLWAKESVNWPANEGKQAVQAEARIRRIMLRRIRYAALVSAGIERAYAQLEGICHPEVVAWARGHAAKQQALVDTCVSLPTHLWSCSTLGARAQRTYEIWRRENAAAERQVRALLTRGA